MPRPTRIYVAGALCLVSCRAVEGMALFIEPRDYDTYLALLAEYRQRYGFKLFAYVLLPDAVHLLVEPTNGATVSTFMHALDSRYTKYVIKRRGPTPRLFDRFKLTVLEKAPSLLRCTGYLHALPRRNGMASDVTGYRWSNYQSYLAAAASGVRPQVSPSGQGVGSDPGTSRSEVAEVLQALGQARPGWTYALYVESVPEEDWQRMSRELERPAVGSPEFLARVDEKRKAAASPESADTLAMATPKSAATSSGQAGRRSPILTASLAMAFVSVIAALLSARNVSFLKSTLRSVAEESGQVLLALGSRTPTLASLETPERLDGTSWQVQLKPTIGTEVVASADHLEFSGERMVSETLREAGFLPGLFRATPSARGLAWETVQIGPGGEIVSWRGESSGRTVHGTVTRQRPGGSIETFRFVGMNAQRASET